MVLRTRFLTVFVILIVCDAAIPITTYKVVAALSRCALPDLLRDGRLLFLPLGLINKSRDDADGKDEEHDTQPADHGKQTGV